MINGAEEKFFKKLTKHWVGVALATNLEVLKLLSCATGSFSWTMVHDVRKAVLIVQLQPYNFSFILDEKNWCCTELSTTLVVSMDVKNLLLIMSSSEFISKKLPDHLLC